MNLDFFSSYVYIYFFTLFYWIERGKREKRECCEKRKETEMEKNCYDLGAVPSSEHWTRPRVLEFTCRIIDSSNRRSSFLSFFFLYFYFNSFSLISRFPLFFFLILILFCLQKTPINNERHGEPDRKGGWVVIIPKQQELIVESQSTPGYILNTGWINQNPETI